MHILIRSKKEYIKSLVRVNHAGEYGAKRIYEGQLSVLSKRLGSSDATLSEVQHMKEQELEHLKYFEDLMIKKGVRPTFFHKVWHVGAFCMGFVSAALGKGAAMACTSAVEEVIDEHYKDQVAILKSINENELADTIENFRLEELEHKRIGDSYASIGVIQAGVKVIARFVTKAAISISKRV